MYAIAPSCPYIACVNQRIGTISEHFSLTIQDPGLLGKSDVLFEASTGTDY